MRTQRNSIIASCAFATGWAFTVFVFQSEATGQSDIVFMTTSSGSPSQSKLRRLDAGVETFATDTGARGLFAGAAVLNGELLVADFWTDQIQRFAPDGSYLGVFAPFFLPSFLETDRSNNVYVVSNSSSTDPVRLSLGGLVTQTFDHGDLKFAVGIDADAAGNVYISNGGPVGEHKLFKFASDGTFLNCIPLGAINPGDLSIDESSNLLYMADQESNISGIRVFDISAPVPSQVDAIATPTGTSVFGMHFAVESGNIFAVHLGGLPNSDPRGLEYSSSGDLLREYRPANAVTGILDITTFVPEPATMLLITIALAISVGWRSSRTTGSC